MKIHLKAIVTLLHAGVVALALPSIAGAQETSNGASAAPKQLRIEIIRGNGALNNVRHRLSGEPIVEVRDENGKPIAGASVLFTLPNHGASATFADGSFTFSDDTQVDGRAEMRAAKANSQTGEFKIRVDVQYGELQRTIFITQTNKWLIWGISAGKFIPVVIAVGGAAAAGGAVAVASRGGASGGTTGGSPIPTVPTATVGIGTGPVIGPPH